MYSFVDILTNWGWGYLKFRKDFVRNFFLTDGTTFSRSRRPHIIDISVFEWVVYYPLETENQAAQETPRMLPLLIAKQRLKLLSYATPTVDSIKDDSPPRYYQKIVLNF